MAVALHIRSRRKDSSWVTTVVPCVISVFFLIFRFVFAEFIHDEVLIELQLEVCIGSCFDIVFGIEHVATQDEGEFLDAAIT